jgi:hypothetical protein
VAVESQPKPAPSAGFNPILIVVMLIAVTVGAGLYWWLSQERPLNTNVAALTAEAKAYVRNLGLSEVEMKATESYAAGQVVEILGKIRNNGDRALKSVEVNCVFYDPYNQVVLRERSAIVRQKMGGLKPGEQKSFRLAFDSLPESWNRQMPQLVIASIGFE